jgi:hypothetical protein
MRIDIPRRRLTMALPLAAVVGLPILYSAGAFAPRQPAGDSLGSRRFRTPEITAATRIGERFTMNASGLLAIRVHAVAVGTVAGRVRVELRSLEEDGQVIRRADVPAANLVGGETYRFAFPAIADSNGHVYRLDLSSSPEAPSRGVALWATSGERLPSASLIVDGNERQADLAFQTEATEVLPAPIPLPNVRRGKVQIALTALSLAWCGVFLAVRALARAI